MSETFVDMLLATSCLALGALVGNAPVTARASASAAVTRATPASMLLGLKQKVATFTEGLDGAVVPTGLAVAPITVGVAIACAS